MPRFLISNLRFELSTLLLCLLLALADSAPAATLSDPAVDSYNMRVGTQTFNGQYQFTTNTLLVETANAITNMGSDTLKMLIGSGFFGQYHIANNPSITSLVGLVKSEPSCRRVFDMPFRHYILWTYAFSTGVPDWKNGYTSSSDQANDYREFYDLTSYLLTNYNNSGKTFYLGHWEGDGYLSVNNWSTNPPLIWCTGFVNYLNNRQKAIDTAKADVARTAHYTNVEVFGYAECNRVRDAMSTDTNNNVRMINYVIPYVTNLDYVSYSSYDMQRLDNPTRTATMNYIESHLPTNKVSVIPGERVWIGEYGYANAGDDPNKQEPETRTYIQWLLNYGSQGIPYVLFWEIYDNELNSDGSPKYFYLIDPSNNPAPCYFLHQRYLNSARLMTAQFKERNGRLPSDSEFVGLVSPMLDNPLPAPVPITVANAGACRLGGTSYALAGTVTQGVYGDGQALLRLYYGRQDGGTSFGAWESSQVVALNTRFSPTTFTTLLTGLVPNTNYFYRFYAANAGTAAWAPTSGQFTTETLQPSAYARRMRISFSGYNRSETLTNLPVLVNLSTSLPGFSYQQFASASGGDLRFTDGSGVNLIPYEIDEWNPSGASTVWVRVPQVAGTNDCIWAYWGNAAATVPPAWSTNGSVWSADHYCVWHLKESALPFADSAQEYPATAGTPPTSTTGFIGKGSQFNGSSQYLNPGVVNLGSAFTISAWVKTDSSLATCLGVLTTKPGGWNSAGISFYVNTYQTADGELRFETGDGVDGVDAATATGAVSPNVWHRISAAVDRNAGTARVYVDGVDRTVTSVALNDFPLQNTMNLGRFTNGSLYFKGAMDEVRIETGARSTNWLWANWATAAANTSLESYSALNPVPTLAMSASGNGPLLSWPANAGAFMLYTTTNLAAPQLWSPATNVPVLSNGQYQVTLPPDGTPARFYRLQLQ